MAILKGPYPTGEGSTISIVIGGYVPNDQTGIIVGLYKLEYAAYVRKVFYTYTGGTADLDAVALTSTGGTGRTLVASANMSGDLTAALQTLHADVLADANHLDAGDEILLKASSDVTDESGFIWAQIELRPIAV